MVRLRTAMWAVPVVGILLAGCGGSSSSSSTPSSSSSNGGSAVTVTTKAVSGLGTVLVTSKGLTLYSFAPDQHAKVTCVGACAAVWPPLKLGNGQQADATGAAKSSLLGSAADPAGGRVVTYNGWPLYTYVVDRSPGQATGQAIKLNGGLWYVLGPSGVVIHKKA